MAQHQPGNAEGTVDKRRAVAASAAVSTGSVATPVDYNSMAGLDAALTTANGAYYTAARLNTMNMNDKIYALRMTNDAGGVG